MWTEQSSLPDWLSPYDRVEEWAFRLRMSTDVLLGILRRHGTWANPGDRVPADVVLDAAQAELDAGRAWVPEQLTRA